MFFSPNGKTCRWFTYWKPACPRKTIFFWDCCHWWFDYLRLSQNLQLQNPMVRHRRKTRKVAMLCSFCFSLFRHPTLSFIAKFSFTNFSPPCFTVLRVHFWVSSSPPAPLAPLQTWKSCHRANGWEAMPWSKCRRERLLLRSRWPSSAMFGKAKSVGVEKGSDTAKLPGTGGSLACQGDVIWNLYENYMKLYGMLLNINS